MLLIPQVGKLVLSELELAALLPSQQPGSDTEYVSAVQRVASTLGGVCDFRIKWVVDADRCRPVVGGLRVSKVGRGAPADAMVRALKPAAHKLTNARLQADPAGAKQQLTPDLVAALGETLGRHTSTLGLSRFGSSSSDPVMEQQLWVQLLRGMPKLLFLHIVTNETSTLQLAALAAAADAAQRPLELLVQPVEQSTFMRRQAKALATSSSMLTVVLRAHRWGPGGVKLEAGKRGAERWCDMDDDCDGKEDEEVGA